jgi:hypothetical protein
VFPNQQSKKEKEKETNTEKYNGEHTEQTDG